MDKVMNHRGYQGSVETSLEDEVLFGQVLNINDLVTYEATTVKELATAFCEAVDDYLAFCEEGGHTPDKPLSGSFNVRVGRELHAKAVAKANTQGIGLNDFVKNAIGAAVRAPERAEPMEIHHHYHPGDRMSAVWNREIDLTEGDITRRVRPALKVVK